MTHVTHCTDDSLPSLIVGVIVKYVKGFDSEIKCGLRNTRLIQFLIASNDFIFLCLRSEKNSAAVGEPPSKPQ